jgi:hypothetical protein
MAVFLGHLLRHLSASESKSLIVGEVPQEGAGRRNSMSRGSGMGLLVFGIVLGIVGAIMRFAVKVHTTGFNIHMAGVILLVVGIAAAVVGLVLLTLGSRSRSMTQESVQSTPTGQVRTEERTDTGFGE